MPFLIPDPNLAHIRCEVVHLDGDPLGVRLVQSPSSPLVLAAAPWARLPTLLAGLGDLRVAAYVLAGSSYPEGAFLRAYVGESGSIRERLTRHARDPRKSFASSVFVLTSRDPAYCKPDVAALQFLLDRGIEAADRGVVVRGAAPVPPDIDAAAWARAEAMIAQARFLFAATGCWLLEPRSPAAVPAVAGLVAVEPATSIGSVTPPPQSVLQTPDHAAPLTPDVGSRTFLLDRGGLWAMAAEVDGRIVIRVGSEMARASIASCDPSTLGRREALRKSGSLVAVPGRPDRWRLLRDAPISSLTGAARVLTGSHCGGHRWRPILVAQPAT